MRMTLGKFDQILTAKFRKKFYHFNCQCFPLFDWMRQIHLNIEGLGDVQQSWISSDTHAIKIIQCEASDDPKLATI